MGLKFMLYLIIVPDHLLFMPDFLIQPLHPGLSNFVQKT